MKIAGRIVAGLLLAAGGLLLSAELRWRRRLRAAAVFALIVRFAESIQRCMDRSWG